MVLDEKTYGPLREAIILQLGNNAKELVSGIDLS